MKAIQGAWAVVLLLGCGSAGAPKAADPTDETTKEAPASGDPETAAPSSSSSPAKSEGAPEETAAPAALSPSDVQAVLQAVLDDPELTSYLHLDKHGRSPVKMSGPDLPDSLKLTKGGYPVAIVGEPRSDKDPVVAITRIDLEGAVVSVAYHYDVEKIRGTTKVKRGKSSWELMSSRIMER